MELVSLIGMKNVNKVGNQANPTNKWVRTKLLFVKDGSQLHWIRMVYLHFIQRNEEEQQHQKKETDSVSGSIRPINAERTGRVLLYKK